jgi:hypothetical protein
MPTLLATMDALPALRIVLLCGGIATFCAAILCRSCPVCAWLEWACDGGGDPGPDAAQD